MQNYFGDPYIGCRPECIQNSDCAYDKACFNTKCISPCAGACDLNAECKVINHLPVCTCLPGFTGNPLLSCQRKPPNSKKSFRRIYRNLLDEPKLTEISLEIKLICRWLPITHVCHHHAERTVIVAWFKVVQCVHVNRTTMVPRHSVDRSAPPILSVLVIDRAWTIVASIHVRVSAVIMPFAAA